MLDLPKAKDFAEKLAKNVGQYLIENQGQTKIIQYKDRQDICTNIDLVAEKMVISTIEKSYPDHNILSEEKGFIDKKSQYTWIIDPLDGTKEYFRHIPKFNTTLSLWHKGEILLGVVYCPIENELFSAQKGEGAYCNNKKVSVSREQKLANSFIFSYFPRYSTPDKLFQKMWRNLGNLLRKSYRLRGANDQVTTLSWIASGRCEGFLTQNQNIWDVAAGILMVQEAGGRVTDKKGKSIKVKNNKIESLVASNGKIHDQILKIIKN